MMGVVKDPSFNAITDTHKEFTNKLWLDLGSVGMPCGWTGEVQVPLNLYSIAEWELIITNSVTNEVDQQII